MNFDIHLLFSALRARYRIFFLILATTVVATLIVSLIVPKTYVAKVSLLLDGKDDQSMRNTAAPPERERAGYMQTQIDIITSPKVAYRVIGDLQLGKNPDLRAAFDAAASKASIEDWLAEALLKQVKVDTSQSSIVQVSFAADEPRFAAQVANAFAKAYVDTVLELRVEPTRQTSIWFDEQLKVLRGNMEQAEKRLTDFQQENGIVAADERYDIENIQLADLAGLVVRSREPANGAADGRSSAAGRDSLPEVLAHPGIQSLKTDLLRAETRLQERSAELGSQHPQYLRQLAEVQGLRERVNVETRNVVAGSEQAAQRSRQRKERLLGEMEAQRDRVLGLKQARNQLAVLTHDVDISQRTYDAAMQRFMASRIESHALQTNVSVLNPAVPPSRPLRPRLDLNLVIALVVGTLLGLAAVHLMETFDQRVRGYDDLAGNPQVPLLGTLNSWNPVEVRRLGPPAVRPALPEPG